MYIPVPSFIFSKQDIWFYSWCIVIICLFALFCFSAKNWNYTSTSIICILVLFFSMNTIIQRIEDRVIIAKYQNYVSAHISIADIFLPFQTVQIRRNIVYNHLKHLQNSKDLGKFLELQYSHNETDYNLNK